MSNLRTIRLNQNLSQSQLSEKAGVNKKMIAFYEQGVKDINKASGETLYKLARALGCNMENLMEDIEE